MAEICVCVCVLSPWQEGTDPGLQTRHEELKEKHRTGSETGTENTGHGMIGSMAGGIN